MRDLVYAEVSHITSVMRADRKVKIISDGALFIVTDRNHSTNYYFDWYPVSEEAVKAYEL